MACISRDPVSVRITAKARDNNCVRGRCRCPGTLVSATTVVAFCLSCNGRPSVERRVLRRTVWSTPDRCTACAVDTGSSIATDVAPRMPEWRHDVRNSPAARAGDEVYGRVEIPEAASVDRLVGRGSLRPDPSPSPRMGRQRGSRGCLDPRSTRSWHWRSISCEPPARVARRWRRARFVVSQIDPA